MLERILKALFRGWFKGEGMLKTILEGILKYILDCISKAICRGCFKGEGFVKTISEGI